MLCPSCSEPVDDGVAVCPHCDAIVDPSAFDDSPRPSKPAAKRPTAAKTTRPAAKKPGAKRPAGAKPKRPKPAAAAEPATGAGDWRSRIDASEWNQNEDGSTSPAPEPFAPDRGVDADDFLTGMRLFVTGLSTGDKLTFFGAVAGIVACFFPWRESIAEGDVLGLTGPGLVTFLMATGTLVALVLRVNRSVKVNELLLWAGQLGSLTLGVLFAFVAIYQSWNPTLARAIEGNQEVWVSKPGFGALVAVVAGAVAALGTVLGLQAKGR